MLLTGCGKNEERQTNAENVDDFLTNLNSKLEVEGNKNVVFRQKAIKPEDKETIFGTDNIDYIEAIISTPIDDNSDFQSILIRVHPDSNITNMKKIIRRNINNNRYGEYLIDLDRMRIFDRDDLIFIIINDDSTNPDIEKIFAKN